MITESEFIDLYLRDSDEDEQGLAELEAREGGELEEPWDLMNNPGFREGEL